MPDEKLAAHPIDNVTWYQAFAFCRWLSASLSWAKGARLPAEEEWEYACRAGTKSRYWSGNKEADLERVGWYKENSEDRTHRVGRKAANPWGFLRRPRQRMGVDGERVDGRLLRARRRRRGRPRGGRRG